MTSLVFHHNPKKLPVATSSVVPVQLYGVSGLERGDVSAIGSPVVDKIQRLGVELTSEAVDFLSIALAVVAADTFVLRDDSTDGWCRNIKISLPLHKTDRWEPVREKLQKALHFLSGDQWEFKFRSGGFSPPAPYKKKDGFKLVNLQELDAVCLFSGGLDSAIGAIDLIHAGRRPLLVSHTYKSDKKHQDLILEKLSYHSHFGVNAHPVSENHQTDITMRTRSIGFIAFAAVAACAVKAANNLSSVELFVPENGFISLNAPLTKRRIGSLSTRTTHPYFLGLMQEIMAEVELPCTIINPYQFFTKGEMVVACKNQASLKDVVGDTVSCSHWKRKNQQCGYCVPCSIRRAALFAGGYLERGYVFDELKDAITDENRRDDVIAVWSAITQKNTREIGPWISDSGPLPLNQYDDFQDVFVRGLEELDSYFMEMGIK